VVPFEKNLSRKLGSRGSTLSSPETESANYAIGLLQYWSEGVWKSTLWIIDPLPAWIVKIQPRANS